MFRYFGMALCAAITLMTSCNTISVVNRAEGMPAYWDSHDTPSDKFKPAPGFYLLLPVAIPLDIITFPYQIYYVRTHDMAP